MTSWSKHKLTKASELEGTDVHWLRINDRHVLFAVGELSAADMTLIRTAVDNALAVQARLLDPAFLAKVAKATDENEHTNALILIAERAGFSDIKSQLAYIDRQHRKVGHLPNGFGDKRSMLMWTMMNKLDASVADELKKCL